jgi:hypothetical protein
MKKLLTILVSIILLVNSVEGQTPKNHFLRNLDGKVSQNKTMFYGLTTSTATYNNLVNPISLTEGDIWDDPTVTINLPFDFKVFNLKFNTILFDGLGAFLVNEFSLDTTIYILANSADLIDRGYDDEVSLSSINYIIDGNVGSRICKIEWKNVGSYDEGTPYTMFFNLQLWLYEGSNILEWRYGPSSITDIATFYYEELGPMSGLAVEVGSNLIAEVIGGTIQNPQLTTNLVALEGHPANGTIYRLTPSTSQIEDFQHLNFTIYPNPVQNILNIETKQNNATVSIYDYTGKLILSEMISETGVIDVSNITSGIYMVKIENGGIASTQKFVKQ